MARHYFKKQSRKINVVNEIRRMVRDTSFDAASRRGFVKLLRCKVNQARNLKRFFGGTPTPKRLQAWRKKVVSV